MSKQLVNEAHVFLDFYNPEYNSILQDYHLPEEQVKFTALPSEVNLEINPELERYPIVILYQGKPAGFFILQGWAKVKEYCSNKDALILTTYSVHTAFQGKGIATQSLLCLEPFVQRYFPNKNEVILAVNQKNTVAQHVYLKAGFIDKGIRVLGPIGEQFVLHKEID